MWFIKIGNEVLQFFWGRQFVNFRFFPTKLKSRHAHTFFLLMLFRKFILRIVNWQKIKNFFLNCHNHRQNLNRFENSALIKPTLCNFQCRNNLRLFWFGNIATKNLKIAGTYGLFFPTFVLG